MYRWQLRILQSILIVSALVLSNSQVQALPMNMRPVQDIGQNSSEPSLQQIFNNLLAPGGTLDAIGDQSNFALFTNQASAGALASFVIEVAGFASQNKFGIYSAQNSDMQGVIFDGYHSQGDQALISFRNDDIFIMTLHFEKNSLDDFSYNIVKGFGNVFGFYIQTPENKTFYTEDYLNPGGNPQALLYQGAGQTLAIPGLEGGKFTPDHFIFAFEDKPFASSDKDFQDLVVLVESISPVPTPEPGTMLLLGTGLLTMAGYRWRRQKQMQ
jgi:hypothetical protein